MLVVELLTSNCTIINLKLWYFTIRSKSPPSQHLVYLIEIAQAQEKHIRINFILFHGLQMFPHNLLSAGEARC